MSRCDGSTGAICACGTLIHPRAIFNPPGRDAIAYRVGDYTSFRHALLQALPGETQLTQAEGARIIQIWRPGGSGDLAVQMMEWWAYLADVLTFYNERVASQAYLRTADLPESINRLIRPLGYRPRPGLGASGVLAALASGPRAFTLPSGFQIQNKPGPGQQPQVFELTADTKVGGIVTGPATAPQGELEVNLTTDPAGRGVVPDRDNPTSVSVFVQGTSSLIKAHDHILLVRQPDTPPTTQPPFVVATVSSIAHEKDARNKPVTRFRLAAKGDVLKVTDMAAYIMRATGESAHVYPYADNAAVVLDTAKNIVHLEAVTRQIKVADPILFEDPSGAQSPELVGVKGYKETIFFANNPSNPTVPPSSPALPAPQIPPIPILHTQLEFFPPIDANWKNQVAAVLIRYGWKDVGFLFVPPPVSIGGAGSNSGPTAGSITLEAAAGQAFPVLPGDGPVLVEDAIGNGDTGILDTASHLTLDDPVPSLVPPLRVLFNLLRVTRGKSVVNEVLGNGDAALAGQDFVLQNAPVTYLQSPTSVSGDDYSSTVRVWVNGLEWKETRSFYGQSKDAQLFVTEEDENGKTHVHFGDGRNGARLPTGVNNVSANYRYGSGARTPDPGSLTVVLQPQPGLKAIRNPVPVGGGSDPDSPSKIRTLAPRSVLAFNRAVSVDDFETIAAQAPGVTRARASFAFDAIEQRPRVRIWVGDNAGAVGAARSAIAAAADPNRLPRIELATQILVSLGLTLIVDPRRDAQTVRNAVHDALLDPDHGLLGVNVVRIGQAFYDSQIYATCLAVGGVQALHAISFIPLVFQTEAAVSGETLTPAAQRVGVSLRAPLPLSQPALAGCPSDHRHDPGDGGYFFLPDDGQHLTLAATVGS